MKKLSLIIAMILLFAVMAAYTATAAVDAFMKIDGVPGESTESGYEGWIDLIEFSYSMSSPASRLTGKRTGRTQLAPITFTKTFDKASPLLMMHCSTGQNITEIRIEVLKSGISGRKDPYFTIVLKKVTVTSYDLNADLAGDSVIEKVTISFQDISVVYEKDGIEYSDSWSRE